MLAGHLRSMISKSKRGQGCQITFTILTNFKSRSLLQNVMQNYWVFLKMTVLLLNVLIAHSYQCSYHILVSLFSSLTILMLIVLSLTEFYHPLLPLIYHLLLLLIYHLLLSLIYYLLFSTDLSLTFITDLSRIGFYLSLLSLFYHCSSHALLSLFLSLFLSLTISSISKQHKKTSL